METIPELQKRLQIWALVMMFAAATIGATRQGRHSWTLWTETVEHLICLSIYIYLHKLQTCSLPRLQVMPRGRKDDQPWTETEESSAVLSSREVSYLAGMSPYISLKKKKRHYEYHMIETHIQLST